MIKVLVTGAGGGVGQGIIKSLHLIKDLDIYIVSADMDALATGLYAGNISYLVPACNSPEYLTEISNICKYENIEYYFPGTDLELQFCALNRDFIKDNFDTNVVVSNIEAIDISDDKYKTYLFLKNNNFNYPKTSLQNNINLNSLQYPLIIKPIVGCRSIGVSIANEEEELKSRLSNEDGLLVQELIGNDNSEYTCTIVALNGETSDVLILKRYLRSGDTFRAEPIKNKKISDYVKNVAIALDIHGSCNFQLRMDKNDMPKIFEINCRFSGTTPFCSQLGFNPVEFYIKTSMGISYHSTIDYDSIVLRHWSEVLIKKEDIEKLSLSKKTIPTFIKKISLFEYKNE